MGTLNMKIKHLLFGAGASLAAIGVAVGMTGAAHASTTTNISIPNVSITSMNNLTVPAKVSGAVSGGSVYYAWDVKASPNYSDSSTHALGAYSGYLGEWADDVQWWPGLNPLGEYHAYPSASWGATDPGAENTATFYVRLGAREQIGVSRSGSRVSVRACVQRYNDNEDGYYGRGGWQNWTGHYTTIYQFRSGGIYGKGRWVGIKSMVTGSNGCTSTYTFTYGLKREYKGVTAGTSTIWGATSSIWNR
jgi:hypothetical protein